MCDCQEKRDPSAREKVIHIREKRWEKVDPPSIDEIPLV